MNGLRYTVLMSPKKGETNVHCCVPALSVLQCHVGVLRRLLRSISLLLSASHRFRVRPKI